MRPKFLTFRNITLLLVAATIFSGLAIWIKNGMPLPGSGVPSTAGKIAFIATRNGQTDLYMIDSAGTDAVALTEDKAEEQSPRWSPKGNEITFTSNRSGVISQVYRMDAMANARALQVTNTSSTKEYPRFTSEDMIHFLDAGKVVSADITSNETDAIFPAADQIKLLSELFSTGGVEHFEVSADKSRYLLTMKLEDGFALTLLVPDESALLLLGVGEGIHANFRPDGSIIAAFSGGAPLQQPQVLLSPKIAEGLAAMQMSLPAISLRPPGEVNFLATLDSNGIVQGAPEPFPVPIEEMAVSPDGSKIALAFSEGERQGLLVHDMNQPGEIQLLFSEPAQMPSWSPDGTQLAFVSKGDLYVIPATGGDAKNLTNGNGENSSPVWSPAQKQVSKK